eukprot:6458962-Amphidinium_carterae.2
MQQLLCRGARDCQHQLLCSGARDGPCQHFHRICRASDELLAWLQVRQPCHIETLRDYRHSPFEDFDPPQNGGCAPLLLFLFVHGVGVVCGYCFANEQQQVRVT